jgi:hypothetical protein
MCNNICLFLAIAGRVRSVVVNIRTYAVGESTLSKHLPGWGEETEFACHSRILAVFSNAEQRESS